MAIKFLLLVNKQGQTRLAKYYNATIINNEERRALEAEIVRKCLTRADKQCNIVEHRNYKVIYRRYASLFVLIGIDEEENELGMLEFIHCCIETLDKWFANVCELDIMFSLETTHHILDEMIMNGTIVETNKSNALMPVQLLEKARDNA